MKIILFDIETTPIEGSAWRPYDTTLIKVTKEWELLSIAYKELGSKIVHCITREGQKTDKQLTEAFLKVLNTADVIIGHNGDKFDIKKLNTKLEQHCLGVPRAFITRDTLKIARKYFAFTSNRLNDLAVFLGVGKKAETGGYTLWEGCINGDKKAWAQMKKYNKQDVVLLEGVYNRLSKWDHTGNKKLSKKPKPYKPLQFRKFSF